MKVLGIETSCDETAAALVESLPLASGQRRLKMLSNSIASSVDLHTAYGGVVPEIAARSHIESILPVIDDALKTAKTDWPQIDAIAVTYGPGLIGSLLIGVLTARTLAIAKNKPLYRVDHVMAHPCAAFLTETSPSLSTTYKLSSTAPAFPMLALIISGGHTQLVLFKNHFDFKMLGQTLDDAVGEAFDKVAKMLGLPYPGGPSIAKAAEKGDPTSVKLPKAKLENAYNFSFSGLKTAVLRSAQQMAGSDYSLPSSKLPKLLSDKQKNDIAASFQRVAAETLVDGLSRATEEFSPASVVIAGGVAANQELRKLASNGLNQEVIYPDIKLCTDNAAMIAALGCFQASSKRPAADPYSLEPNPGLTM